MHLNPALRSRAMRLSLWEGGCYAAMAGTSEAFFVADMVRLGASPALAALVVTLPLCCGSAGPLLALALLRRLTHRRVLVLAAVLGQVANLAVLSALEAHGRSGPVSLLAAACVHQFLAQLAGVTWSSWYGDVVPREVRGRYFAGRNRVVHAVTCVSLLGGGLFLHHLEPLGPLAPQAGGSGFAILFGLAALFRLVSGLLLALSPEPKFRGLPTLRRLPGFLRSRRGRGISRMLLGGAVLQLGVYLASPYFNPFLLQGLGLDYLAFTLAGVVQVVCKSVALPLWGRMVDQLGARAVFELAAILVALVPLPWLWADGLLWVLVAEVASGFSWAAHEISYFALLLDGSISRSRPLVFAAQNLCNGAAQLGGTVLGAAALGLAGGEMRWLFGLSLLVRLGVASTVPRWAPRRMARGVHRRAVLMQVVGMRPHGGLTHRAIEPPAARPPDPSAPAS